MADKSGPQEAVEGVVEGAKGKAKEVFGAVTGRDDVKYEGEAQRNAAKKEAEAESVRGAARASEERQKANQ
jgi:uncharacterized protein YjbJ (UPF0337 family)